MQPDLLGITTSTIMEGISQGEFVPYLQPQMDASIGSLWGAEALVRWISPKYGFIMPGDFIPQLEKTGLICKIDYYIFEEICKLKRKWKNENLHYAGLAISINMSRRHFDEPDFVDTIPPPEVQTVLFQVQYFSSEMPYFLQAHALSAFPLHLHLPRPVRAHG